jgi:hypothetical protein
MIGGRVFSRLRRAFPAFSIDGMFQVFFWQPQATMRLWLTCQAWPVISFLIFTLEVEQVFPFS